MGKVSKIAWTDATHNFWYGCKKVDESCHFCYAERDMKRYGKNFGAITRAKGFSAPLKWKEPQRIFTCSWSDFFIPEADDWREEAWNIIQSTPQHTYMILTKRPENILSRLPWDWGEGYKNVWLGVSTANQKRADERIPTLLSIPARIRFISAEPLLGPIDLTGKDIDSGYLPAYATLNGVEMTSPGIDWVIAGSESGSEARPCDLKWVRLLRDQCMIAQVAFFWKQHIVDGQKIEMPKLDGRIWDELPQK